MTLEMTNVTTGIVHFGIVSRSLPCRDPAVMVMWSNQQGKYVLFKREMLPLESLGSVLWVELYPAKTRMWWPSEGTKKLSIFTACVRSTTGKYCFHRCGSIHGREGYPCPRSFPCFLLAGPFRGGRERDTPVRSVARFGGVREGRVDGRRTPEI